MVSVALALMNQESNGRMRSLRTSYRFSRVVAHCSKLSVKLPSHYLLRKLIPREDEHLLENASFKKWLDKLVRLLNVEVSVEGEPPINNGLFVSNHISWVDAVVLASINQFSFIAKEEVKSWPLIGPFGQMARTVYIQRQSKFSVYRSLPQLERQLNLNRSLLLFPEGTTTTGRSALPFFPMLYESAVRAKKPVQAIAIRYTDLNNNFLPEVGFVEEDTLFDTLFRMMKGERIIAHIHFLNSIDENSMTRKEMAIYTQKSISNKLLERLRN